jgi:hypothetical protein
LNKGSAVLAGALFYLIRRGPGHFLNPGNLFCAVVGKMKKSKIDKKMKKLKKAMKKAKGAKVDREGVPLVSPPVATDLI